MHAQYGASSHDSSHSTGDKERQHGSMWPKGSTATEQEDVNCQSPPDGRGPVSDKGEQADGGGVEAGDAVVGAGQVDGGDGVGAAKGEEGHLLHEEGGGADFGNGERRGEGEEEAVLVVHEEEEGDVGGAGLGHGEEGECVVEGGCFWGVSAREGEKKRREEERTHLETWRRLDGE